MIQKEISFIVSSDPLNGAINLTNDGSRFKVQFEDPLIIPREATNLSVSVEEAIIWWTSPNVISGVNSEFYLDDNGTTRNVSLPTGLYDLTGLNAALNREIVDAGGISGLVTLTADTSTQKIVLTVAAAQQTIDFTQSDTFRDILGFNSQSLTNGATSPKAWLADNVAKFNVINYYLIHSDIISSGLRYNNKYSQILKQVNIDVAPGSQIVSTDFNPPRIDEDNLIGSSRTRLAFWLTNDKNELVNTGGEYWSSRIVIRYQIEGEMSRTEKLLLRLVELQEGLTNFFGSMFKR